ncbi:Dienelactone hydrolase domain-containing protein [Caenorhabditis elegans]|uniref:Dienelactone hydrolase domain-containing protein n=1 Tax=Caenorhabditis elegans TaxID=6239 RepID=O17263_CAEEL|nr:Dienelactone hydrolase domain-containing protein [Caenorhabditis elegans]CCD73621.1 Dienelactone hydrolase domain-containing protein [Caenorhabditis elegans]|eukprot:NP_493925.1 DieneLactone Hydrolase Domain containing protein [Caenorhabditis elegans]
MQKIILASLFLIPLSLGTIDFNPIVTRLVEYRDSQNTVLEGYLAYPVITGFFRKRPAVIIFHAFTGRTEFDNQKARDLAKLGYVAFAADTYGKGKAAPDVNGNFAIMGQLLGNRTTILRNRIISAWTYVKGLSFVDTNNIGSIGFCFGGLCTLDLARFNVGLKAAVSFHGTLTDYPGNGTAIDASIQAHHGDADPHTTNENAEDFIEEMRRRNGDWMFSRYAHALHAFTLPGVENWGIPGAAFDPIASNRSWSAMEAFLAEKLLN